MAMVFTHSGRLGDFFTTQPIYSAWYKKYNEPVTIAVPKNFPFIDSARDFVLQFDFINDFVVTDFSVWHFDCGGVPYVWNPNEHGLTCEKWINLGFKHIPDKNVAQFCAEDYNLEIDQDFSIRIEFDPELHEKYKDVVGFADASLHRDDVHVLKDIMLKTGLKFHTFDVSLPIIENLKIARHCLYNVCSGSAMAILMNFSHIPFSVYSWQTPMHSYFTQCSTIHSIWQSPFYVVEQSKEDILKMLNLI
jgi:hypothetical protein